jgi:branched-chain amino acid transport system substrate-binding protein
MHIPASPPVFVLLHSLRRHSGTREARAPSRDNVMKQTTSLKGLRLPMLLPGISINTSAADHAPILASYNWRPSSDDRYRRLSNMVDKFFSHIAQLQQPPFHPKWREVALSAPVAGWTRVQSAQEWLDRLSPPASAAAPFRESLDEHTTASGPAKPAIPEERKAALRQFLQWRAGQAVKPH